MKKLILVLMISTPLLCSANNDGWKCYGLSSIKPTTEKFVVCISENTKKVTGLLSCNTFELPSVLGYAILDAKENPIRRKIVEQTNSFFSISYEPDWITEVQLRLDLTFNAITAKNLDVTDANARTFEYFVKEHDQATKMKASGTYKELDEVNCYF